MILPNKKEITPMSLPININVDITDKVSIPGALHLACSVYLPDPANLPDCPTVIFAVPGGGYTRHYYDLQLPGHEHYSEAQYHRQRGTVFISCDHLGVGESSVPDPTRITFEVLAAAYAATVTELVGRIKNGTIAPLFPAVENPTVIGIGQSMGGCVTILTQGQHAVFDAIVPMGYSAIHTVMPQRTAEDRQRAIEARFAPRDTRLETLSVEESSRSIADYVYPFHWEDVPRDILDADMAGGYPIRTNPPPWGSATIPPCATLMMGPGVVSAEAHAVRVPVLVVSGERDTVPNPHAEPTAFPTSEDVSVFVVPRMAHMHNFASTRQVLWQRTHDWSRMIANAQQG